MRHEGWRPVHQISDRRCRALPNSEWVLIDPGAEAEKERWPGEDPVQHAVVSKGVVIGYWIRSNLFRVTMMRPARNMPEVASPSELSPE